MSSDSDLPWEAEAVIVRLTKSCATHATLFTSGTAVVAFLDLKSRANLDVRALLVEGHSAGVQGGCKREIADNTVGGAFVGVTTAPFGPFAVPCVTFAFTFAAWAWSLMRQIVGSLFLKTSTVRPVIRVSERLHSLSHFGNFRDVYGQ